VAVSGETFISKEIKLPAVDSSMTAAGRGDVKFE